MAGRLSQQQGRPFPITAALTFGGRVDRFWVGCVVGALTAWMLASLGAGLIIGRLLFRLRSAMQVIGILRAIRPGRRTE